MIFDKNQKEFPSETHRAIWDAGIHIIPLEPSLPRELKEKLPPYMVESCEQLHNYFIYLLSDIYENPAIYEPFHFDERRISIQYKFFIPFADFGLAGEAGENCLTINRSVFDKLFQKQIKSKTYHKGNKYDMNAEKRMAILERTGLKIAYEGNNAVLTNTLFPNVFYAMRAMAQASAKEKGSGDNSFTYCDFRQLCSDYKYDKFENALVFLNDEDKSIVRQLDIIARKLKMTRSIKSGHCPGYNVEYNYKKAKLLDLNCMSGSLTMSVRFTYDKNNTAPIYHLFDEIEKDSDELKKFVYQRLRRCRKCFTGCPMYADAGWPIRIYGKTNKMCMYTDRIGLHMPDGKKNHPVRPDEIGLIEKALIHAVKLADEMA